VVNVVVTDIASKPLQYLREFVKGTPFKRGFHPVPPFMARPVHTFKIVLDIKQPETEHPTDKKNGELNQNIGAEAEDKTCKQNDHQNPEICEVNAVALLFALSPDRSSLIDEENKNGA